MNPTPNESEPTKPVVKPVLPAKPAFEPRNRFNTIEGWEVKKLDGTKVELHDESEPTPIEDEKK